MILPTWCFAGQGLYCAFQEVSSRVSEYSLNATNDVDWELYSLQQLNHDLLWVKAARTMKGLLCIWIDSIHWLSRTVEAGLIPDSWRKQRTSVEWLRSTIPLQAIFILVFRGIPEGKVIWLILDFPPDRTSVPTTSMQCCLSQPVLYLSPILEFPYQFSPFHWIHIFSIQLVSRVLPFTILTTYSAFGNTLARFRFLLCISLKYLLAVRNMIVFWETANKLISSILESTNRKLKVSKVIWVYLSSPTSLKGREREHCPPRCAFQQGTEIDVPVKELQGQYYILLSLELFKGIYSYLTLAISSL